MSDFDSWYMGFWDEGHLETAHRRTGQYTSSKNSPRRYSKLDEVMAEFRLNGLESPYNPDEEEYLNGKADIYRRQRSCPEPSLSTSPQPECSSSWSGNPYNIIREQLSQQLRGDGLDASLDIPLSIPLGYQTKNQPITECRFCKSNGERPWLYNQHRLKDKFGRIVCPVLRAFKCPRCNATGDTAHTLKYCPLTSTIERQHAAAMLRSVRLASERRRPPQVYIQSSAEPDAAWAMLERKLSADTQENNNNVFF